MKVITDVTKMFTVDNPDDEFLPITQCFCGATFSSWDWIIGIYSDDPSECPDCGRKFYFCQTINIYQVKET